MGPTELLTSQFYIDGHRANERDPIFQRLSPSEAAAVSMVFGEADGQTEASVDLIVRSV